MHPHEQQPQVPLPMTCLKQIQSATYTQNDKIYDTKYKITKYIS